DRVVVMNDLELVIEVRQGQVIVAAGNINHANMGVDVNFLRACIFAWINYPVGNGSRRHLHGGVGGRADPEIAVICRRIRYTRPNELVVANAWGFRGIVIVHSDAEADNVARLGVAQSREGDAEFRFVTGGGQCGQRIPIAIWTVTRIECSEIKVSVVGRDRILAAYFVVAGRRTPGRG